MKTKKVFYSELAYVLGVIALAFGTALMERADFGMSMVVAPAYLLYLKISQYVPAFTFGMSEYVFQAALLVVLALIMRRFKKSYLFSFVTAVFYGVTLDVMIWLVGILPWGGAAVRLAVYIIGMLFCQAGVALLFGTYISPEAYELFVKEIAARFGFPMDKTKTVYDCVSCLVGVVLSFCFFGFGHFEGVKLGTVFNALINGGMIGLFARMFEAGFDFKDGLPLRKWFT